MRLSLTKLIPLMALVTLTGALALDPSEVDGEVTVAVDRSAAVWAVKVTNRGEDALVYEMMGKVPRGLGLEIWDDRNDSTAARIHAEDLAESLNIDGFPADIREIAPGASETFRLDPKSMSAADDLALARWERAKRIGYYDCRVIFGIYASRMLSVEPPPRTRKAEDDGTAKKPPAWTENDAANSKEENFLGFKLRRMLNAEKQALVEWHRGSDHRGESYVEYTTCARQDLERLAPWDETKPTELPLHELVAKARALAREKIGECAFEGVMTNPCEDAPSKQYASVYFASDSDDVTVDLLLNGAATKTTRLLVTDEQLKELEEYGIPKVRETNGGGQP